MFLRAKAPQEFTSLEGLYFCIYVWMSHFVAPLPMLDMFETCSWHVQDMFRTCSRHVHDMFTTSSQHVHNMFMKCSQHVQNMFTTCSRHVQNMFTTCLQSRNVHDDIMTYSVFTPWSWHVNVMFTTCSPHVHQMFFLSVCLWITKYLQLALFLEVMCTYLNTHYLGFNFTAQFKSSTHNSLPARFVSLTYSKK